MSGRVTLARSLACPADDGRRADAGEAAPAPPCSDGTDDEDEGPCTRGLAARAVCDAAAAEVAVPAEAPTAAERADADDADTEPGVADADEDEDDGVPGGGGGGAAGGAARRADCEPEEEDDMFVLCSGSVGCFLKNYEKSLEIKEI
jgi:hypothetical protein